MNMMALGFKTPVIMLTIQRDEMHNQRTDEERIRLFNRFIELKKERPDWSNVKIGKRMGLGRSINYIMKWGRDDKNNNGTI